MPVAQRLGAAVGAALARNGGIGDAVPAVIPIHRRAALAVGTQLGLGAGHFLGSFYLFSGLSAGVPCTNAMARGSLRVPVSQVSRCPPRFRIFFWNWGGGRCVRARALCTLHTHIHWDTGTHWDTALIQFIFRCHPRHPCPRVPTGTLGLSAVRISTAFGPLSRRGGVSSPFE